MCLEDTLISGIGSKEILRNGLYNFSFRIGNLKKKLIGFYNIFQIYVSTYIFHLLRNLKYAFSQTQLPRIKGKQHKSLNFYSKFNNNIYRH